MQKLNEKATLNKKWMQSLTHALAVSCSKSKIFNYISKLLPDASKLLFNSLDKKEKLLNKTIN